MAPLVKPLKVGLVLDSGLDKPDGVQQYVLAVGEWLRGQGHDVHYLVGQTRRRDIENVHSLGRSIRVRFNGNNGSIPLLARKSKLRALLAAEQFDILHVQVPHHPLLAQRIILAAGPDTAIIGTFHVAPYRKLVTAGNKALGVWLKPSLRRFDKMVSVSSAAADFARVTFGIETEVVPNVVDYKRFQAAKALPEYDDGTLNILFLGRLVPRKGCQVLLQAVAQLKGRKNGLPKFRVVVCGSGPLEKQLRRFAARHKLAKIVDFKGFVSEADKPRYYASADLAVFPATGGESFGIVLLEAMAGGRTVVLAGDNPGYRSVMSPQSDLLFDADKPGVLADKLAYYLKNQTQRRLMQVWEADYAKQFDVNVVGAKLLSIYHEALRKKRGA
jgi:phosphatidylinositol alpha-mannosyltransferase